jgi:hypothetical protein
VPVDPVQEPAPPPKRGVPRLAVLAGGALLGVVIGRLTKRDEDEY